MKFKPNYNDLTDTLTKKTFKLADVKDKIVKVAFDVVRFKDDTNEELWKIESGSDGDYIIALYEKPEEEIVAKASISPWRVSLSSSHLNIFYKDEPITKIAASKLGLQTADLDLAKRYLPKQLASNKTLVKSLLSELDEVSKDYVISKFPELA